MTILHLEDSTNDALMIESVLTDTWADCRIHRVVSKAEFESALEFERFDLILSDHSLPGFDGLTALELHESAGLKHRSFSSLAPLEKSVPSLRCNAAPSIM